MAEDFVKARTQAREIRSDAGTTFPVAYAAKAALLIGVMSVVERRS
jgi:hypothetical protein